MIASQVGKKRGVNLTSPALVDRINRAGNGNSADLVGGLRWKVTEVLIVVLIVGYVLYKHIS
ncbi:DUF6366 family protein [Bacillus sp. FJAT-45066]|uniref:DUF6366 family protein n=1 Tax=Bacillus sp. FJAT-45066 TaxID=2011010 RepID=UPI00114325BB|nr:DUF6366 family protein [Bacillus sp. FJAT-45066]